MDFLREMWKIFRNVIIRHKVIENIRLIKTLQGTFLIDLDSLQTFLPGNGERSINIVHNRSRDL